jgi:colicin import membrane protein
MESFTDKARAFFYSLAVHLSVFALLFLGLFFFQPARPVALQGPVIEAEIVGLAAAPRPQPQSKPRPEPPKPAEAPEPPKPEPPKPPEVKPPPTVQRNDNKEQEKIADTGMQKAEEAKRAQEEKHRQQQILLEEEKKREEAEAKEKAKQADLAKKLEDIRKEREKAAKQTRLAMEKMKQLDDLQKQQSQPAKPQKAPAADVPVADVSKTGMAGNDTGLLAEYSSAIIKVVTDNWNRPDTVQPGLRCAVHVIQLPGGTVMSAKAVSPCNADQITRTSIEQAVTKAQPLPFKGYESVFQREITFIFRYDG